MTETVANVSLTTGRGADNIGCAIAYLVISLTLSCGEQLPHTANRAAEVRDSAGVRLVTYTDDSLSNDGASWRITADPLLQIGKIEGDDAYLFSAITDATRLSDGRVVVLEAQTFELRAFSSAGVHLWTAGGRGGGPGEFRWLPRALQRLNGDTLQVEDGLLRVRYTARGQLVEHTMMDWSRISELGSYTTECRYGLPLFVADRLLLAGRDCALDGRERVMQSGPRDFVTTMVVLRETLDDVDTLGHFPDNSQWVHSHRGTAMPITIPLAPRGLYAVGGSPPHFAYASTGRYRIDLYDLRTARHILQIRRPAYERLPTARDLQSADQAWDREVDSYRAGIPYGIDPSAIGALREAKDLVEWDYTVSTIRRILVDDIGRIWVGHEVDENSQARSWAVYGHNGQFVADIELPTPLTIHEIGEDYILGTTRDAFNVPYLKLFMIQHDAGRVSRKE